MKQQLETVPEGGRLLMFSHASVIELGVASARPHDALSFGEPVGYLDGVRLTLEGGAWVSGEVVRAA